MRDVLDDDERKVKPLSLLMITTAAILGSMIVYNAMWGRTTAERAQLMAEVPQGATTRMEVVVQPADAPTVTIKYDADIETVQRELLALGQYHGMVDGVNGQRTKSAVELYQQTNGLAITGVVTAELINHIRYTRKIKAASEFTGSVEPAAPLQKVNNSKYIFKAQSALGKLGYDIGEPTGDLDEATKAAILQFQMENGMEMDGKATAGLVEVLAKLATN
jgi:peptidoglycan hydrolase-like protein with peptidoglycan-binding domain